MLKRNCPACAKKIERKFNFCPYCGVSFKARNEQANFGMLGRDDSSGKIGRPEPKMPFGLNGIMNSLIKQLESQLGNMDLGDGRNGGLPKNVKIRVARGPNLGMNQVVRKVPDRKIVEVPEVSDAENERRMGLPKVEVESKVKRLGDTIIYEIDAPGIRKKDDVVLTELASGLEIRAYSKDKCYMKFIPLKVEVVEYYVEKEKVVVEIKG